MLKSKRISLNKEDRTRIILAKSKVRLCCVYPVNLVLFWHTILRTTMTIPMHLSLIETFNDGWNEEEELRDR